MPKQFNRDEGDERDVSLQTLRSVQKLTQRLGDAEKIDQGVRPFTLKVFLLCDLSVSALKLFLGYRAETERPKLCLIFLYPLNPLHPCE